MTASFQFTVNDDQLAMNYQLPIANEKNIINAQHLPSLKIVNCKLLIEATERSDS